MTPSCTNPNGFPYGKPILGVQEALLHLYRPDLSAEDRAAWDMARAGILEASASHRRALDVIAAVNAVEEARRELTLFIEDRSDGLGVVGVFATREDYEEELRQVLGRAEGDLRQAMHQWWSPGAAPLGSLAMPMAEEPPAPNDETRDPATLSAAELAHFGQHGDLAFLQAIRALSDEGFNAFTHERETAAQNEDIPF